jgi:hypothetical protein
MLLFHKLIMTCLQQKMYMLQTGTFTKDENHASLDVWLFDAMFNIRNLIHLMTTCFCSWSVLIQIGNFQEFGVHYCWFGNDFWTYQRGPGIGYIQKIHSILVLVLGTFKNFIPVWSWLQDWLLAGMRRVYAWYRNWYKTGISSGHISLVGYLLPILISK